MSEAPECLVVAILGHGMAWPSCIHAELTRTAQTPAKHRLCRWERERDYNEALVLSRAKQSVALWPTCWISLARVVCDSLLLRLYSIVWTFLFSRFFWKEPFVSGHCVLHRIYLQSVCFCFYRAGYSLFSVLGFFACVCRLHRLIVIGRWASSRLGQCCEHRRL